MAQLVRYCRDSRPASIAEAGDLLRDSAVVCASLSEFAERIDGAGPVGLTDFAGLFGGSLNGWATRLHLKPGVAIAA